MRISDWSSDVCSSDLYARLRAYLDTLPFVRTVQAVSAEGDALTLQLDLASGIEGFRAAIAQGAVLREDADRGEPPSSTEARRVGQSESVRVQLGGGGNLKKNKNHIQTITTKQS